MKGTLGRTLNALGDRSVKSTRDQAAEIASVALKSPRESDTAAARSPVDADRAEGVRLQRPRTLDGPYRPSHSRHAAISRGAGGEVGVALPRVGVIDRNSAEVLNACRLTGATLAISKFVSALAGPRVALPVDIGGSGSYCIGTPDGRVPMRLGMLVARSGGPAAARPFTTDVITRSEHEVPSPA